MKNFKYFFVVLVITLSIVCYNFYSQNKLKIKVNLLTNKLLLADAKNTILEKTIITQIELSNTKINNIPILLGNDSLYFKDLLKCNTPFLILKYSDECCQVCIDSAVCQLLRFTEYEGIDNFLIIVTGNLRSINAYKIANKIKTNIFVVSENNLGIKLEEQNFPFYFMTDSSLKVKNIFISEKYFPQLTEKYFNAIRELL